MRKYLTGVFLLFFYQLVFSQTPVATLFSTEVPAAFDAYTQYELGTEFQTLSAGLITKVRIYSYINESGNHTIRLWLHSGTTNSLVAGPYTWSLTSGVQGWREFTLPTPISVDASKNYIISVTNSTDKYYAKTENFSSATSNSYIRYVGGVYSTTLGSAPTSTFSSSCYFRDVVFALENANGNLTPGTIGTAQTICYNTTPAGLTQLTAPTGGSGTYIYQWQSSSNNTNWTDISGATLPGYSPSALSANTYFRRTVTSGTYTPVNSSSVLITVSPRITLAQLHDNITISNNTSTNFNVVVTGGTSPFSFNYTKNGTAQAAVNNYSSGANVSTGTLTTGAYIYVLTSLTDAAGCTAQSLGTSITVTVTDSNGNLKPGTIGSPQSICYNTKPNTLTQLTAPTGGTGTYTYRWQKSANNTSWTNISGATSRTYSPAALTASTYFRRTVSSGTYTPVYSSSVLITVSPRTTLAQLHDNISIPSNTSANFNVTVTGGTSPYSFNYTRNGVAQPIVSNYTSGANVSTGVLTSGVYTYLLTSLTDAVGCAAQSIGTGITVTVTDGNGNLTAGTIGAPQTICYNTVPNALTQLTAPTGGSGTYTYQWQSSVDNTSWTDIAGATNQGYSPPALSTNTYFRRIVTSGTYTPVNSASVLITVSAQITLAQLHDNISILNNTSTNFNVAVTGGTSPFSFNYTRNGVAQAAVNNYTSGANVSTGTLTTGEYTYVLTSLTDAGGCTAQSLGTSITVTVSDGNGNLTAGTIGTPQSICYNIVPDALTQLTAPTGGSGTYTYQWQSSANNAVWTDIPGAILSGYSPPALPANTYFRCIVSSDTYTPVYSSSVLITVSPQIALAQLHDNISILNNTSTNFNVAVIGGTSPFSFNYTRNGSAQPAVSNYSSGANVSTGSLTSGVYTYLLTSLMDAIGCAAQNLGTGITVTVTDGNGNLTAGTIGAPQSICYNTVPDALTQLTAPTGGSETYTYQWQSSANNTSWTNISGATLPGYSPAALTASTYFRRTVSSGSYMPVNSSSVLITVSPLITLAQLHDNITISNNTSTNINVAVTGGASPFSFNYTRNGEAQPTINNYSSGANVSTGTLAIGIYNYLLTSLTDALGCTAQNLGTGITVTVVDDNGKLTAGTIGTSQSICYNTVPNALTQLTAPTGGSGTYTYQWQSSDNNVNWNDISGATLPGYSPPTLTASTYFRRTVNSGIYTPVYSPSVLITLTPQVTLAELHDNISILNNTSTNFNVAVTGGTPPFSFNYTRNGAAQTAVNNYSSGANVSTGVLTIGVYTYVLTSLSDALGCAAQDLGTGITVTVTDGNGNLTAGTISGPQTICYNTVPAPLTQLAAPTGGSGTYTYQWQSSVNNTSWTNITGATNQDYSPSALTANTYFRRVVSSGTYTPVNSASILITVFPQITLVQLHDDITIPNNTSTNINAAVTGGTSPFVINYTRNGSAQSAISNYTSGANISTGVLSTGVYTYALTSVTDANRCASQNLGTSISVTVSPGSLYQPADSLFRTETANDSNNDTPYELGTKFSTTSSGYFIRARLYTNVNEGGAHSIRLWLLNGSTYTLVAGPYTWNISSGVTGWRQYNFPSAITANANSTYIISITNGPDKNYERTLNFSSTKVGPYLKYVAGTYTTNLGSVPTSTYSASCYFRDIVFALSSNGNLTSGTIGTAQRLCYNTTPAPLTQLTAPTGGSGTYTYQWQSSANNTTWTNITGATNQGYSPPALSTNTYFRRTVSSGTYTPVNSASVLISVSPLITLAQLHDNITIPNNSSTNINVAVTGGTSPFTINYTRNESAQTAINNYTSGANISTGALSTGTYTYTLTSVTDASGCVSQDLGTNIVVTVTDQQAANNSNKALVIVNSGSAYYQDYITYIKPYLENFGIPYDECNINNTSLPQFTDYAVLIFGHKNVYSSVYPISQIEASISNGVGLYSFDPHLFDYASGFNTLISQRSVNSDQINISNTTHYITQHHVPDTFNPTSNVVKLLSNWNVSQTSTLVNGTELANMSSGSQSVPLLQISNYGAGKIVKWCGYDWVFDNILGAVYGMDDLIWRGIVWAARKPFAMQGLPPMFTMRVDDATGSCFGTTDFAWVGICNQYGIIPWLGTFNDYINDNQLPVLKNYLDNNLATAAPHAFWWNDFIYYNHDNVTLFDVAARTKKGLDFYVQNGLKVSKYLVPHYYEISAAALPQLHDAGIEFLGIHMLPDHPYYTSSWINCGPYRINRNGIDDEARPVYYGANVNLSGIDFFNCITEIRDDGGYEWYPDNNIDSTAARGIRHLKRASDSMVLSTLFTHEYYFETMSNSNFREIIRIITSNLSMYNPDYKTIDYAAQYIRAKNNIRITGIVETSSSVEISYSGSNDLDTRCYLFTEQNGAISYSFVQLPQINGSNKVIVSK
jgi:uncharacterized protein GlcG (DUF336 family)